MNIVDAIEEYLAAKQNSITHDTYAWYATYLDQFSAWCKTKPLTDLSQITLGHVQQFATAAKTTNTYTRHARVQIVKGFLAWCTQDDEMEVKEKTIKRIELPKVEQSDIALFSDQEILRLFRACDQMRDPHRNRAIVHLLLDTGVRASELCYDATRPEEETGLRLTNITLTRGIESYIWVMGKGRKPRTIGLGQATAIAVRKYLNRERGHSESPYAFLSRGDEPLSVRMLQQFLHRLGNLAKVEDVHPHRFRHTFAVDQLLNGVSDFVLMQLLGHTTLESTKIYIRAMTTSKHEKLAVASLTASNRGHPKGYKRWIIRGIRIAQPTGILAIIIFALLYPLNIQIVQPVLETIGGVAGSISVLIWIGIGISIVQDSDTRQKPIETHRNNLRIAKKELAKLNRALTYYDEQSLKHLTAEQYMHQLPNLIASYRKQAGRYQNWFIITQLTTIFLSVAITSLSGGWLDRYFSIPWVIPVIGGAISILTSITLFFKFREKGTNLQQAADAMDWEHMACTLGIGDYKSMTKEEAQVELAERAEALRKEQQKKQLQLEQSSHAEQKALLDGKGLLNSYFIKYQDVIESSPDEYIPINYHISRMNYDIRADGGFQQLFISQITTVLTNWAGVLRWRSMVKDEDTDVSILQRLDTKIVEYQPKINELLQNQTKLQEQRQQFAELTNQYLQAVNAKQDTSNTDNSTPAPTPDN